MIINTKYRCVGIKLWKWNSFQVELWLCPKNAEIKAHIHPSVDVKIAFLGGKMMFYKAFKERVMTIKNIFKLFSIPRNTLHGARVLGSFGIFLSIERWKAGVTPNSVAINLYEF
jgi:quercetin dioxygenase-like cupin family protein